MLNPFPTLLYFSINAPAILRIAAALVILFVAYRQWTRREELSRTAFPVVGSGMWIVWFSLVWELATALLLLLGLYTQIGAILGMIIALKFFFWHRRYPAMMVLGRPASLLLFAICLSLLFSGAGEPAFDIFL